jgi:hypothetical protein
VRIWIELGELRVQAVRGRAHMGQTASRETAAWCGHDPSSQEAMRFGWYKK